MLSSVEKYYSEKIRAHGATPLGVDWNSPQSQELRFRQLLRICDDANEGLSICDYGCGYGALADSIAERWSDFSYIGYDLSEEMLAQARSLHAGDRFSFSADRKEIVPADYCVASGIFNVRLGTPEPEWKEYVRDTIADLALLGKSGFAFNALTSYSDADKKRDDLHYADPLELFDLIKRSYTPRVALLHDYPLYEFTILARFEPGTP
ncbi:MAG: class I SAM-dependent methyltransferase [Gemmatimonadaceae bacterium]|nr:class I SAM-dependent methyltransferase [Gemmatimonadaceae bacterium]